AARTNDAVEADRARRRSCVTMGRVRDSLFRIAYSDVGGREGGRVQSNAAGGAAESSRLSPPVPRRRDADRSLRGVRRRRGRGLAVLSRAPRSIALASGLLSRDVRLE